MRVLGLAKVSVRDSDSDSERVSATAKSTGGHHPTSSERGSDSERDSATATDSGKSTGGHRPTSEMD